MSFEHYKKLFTTKRAPQSPFHNVAGQTPESAVFQQLFNPYMPMANFIASFKTLASRNQHSFYSAVKNTCLIVKDAKGQRLVASRDLLNKYAQTLKQEAKVTAKWESQDPRTIQWTAYKDVDNLRIESVYQEFINKFIEGKLQNYHSL